MNGTLTLNSTRLSRLSASHIFFGHVLPPLFCSQEQRDRQVSLTVVIFHPGWQKNHTQRAAGLWGKTFRFTPTFDCFLFLPSFVWLHVLPSPFYTFVLCHYITQTHHEMITIDINVTSFNIITTNHLLRIKGGRLHTQTLMFMGVFKRRL